MSKIIKASAWDGEVTDPQIVDPGDFGPVLDAEVLESLSRGKEIVDRAKAEATRIRKRAKDLLGTVAVEKDAERQRGFEEGHQEGLGQLTEKILAAEARHEEILKEAEPEAVRMVVDSVEKILGREIAKGAVVDVIREAITKAVGRKVVLRVNPGDYLTVQKKMKDLTAVLDGSQTFVMKEDESVTAGGCVVETELGTVDARLEIQLAAIRRAFGLE